MIRKRLLIPVICMGLVFPLFAFSATIAADSEIDYRDLTLEELLELQVVLPTKTASTVDRSPASVSVFTAREIEILGVRYLSELLNLVPGFDVRRYREPTNLVDVRGITGQFNERILVMMDGVRLNDIYNGGIARTVRSIRLDDVEQIEILRGPGSVLYGTDAFAAVINIHTRKGEDVDGIRVSGEYGSFSTYNVNLLGGRQWDKSGFKLWLSNSDSDGETYDINADAVGRSGQISDSFEEHAIGLKYNYEEKLVFSFNYGQREESGFITLSDLLGEDTDYNEGTWLASSLDYRHELSDHVDWDTKLYGAFNRWDVGLAIWPAGYGPAADPEGPFPDGMYGHPFFDDWRYGLDTSANWTFHDNHNFILGITLEQEKTDNNDHISNGPDIASSPIIEDGVFEDNRRSITAGYAQYSGPITEMLRLTAGARYDYYNDFGSELNPRIALVATPNDHFYSKLMYNRAFRAPTFRELYSNNPVIRGDPDNDAETIDTLELVLGYKSLPRFDSSLSLFYNKIDDIILIENVEPGLSLYQNQGEGTSYGFEAEFRAQVTDNGKLTVNFAHIDGDNQVDEIDYDIPFIASDIANLIYTQSILERAQLCLTLQYRGERDRDAALADPRPPVGDYFLTNLHFRLFFLEDRNLEWFVTLNNILDEEYYGPSNYPPKEEGVIADDIPYPGFVAFTGLRYRFGRS